MNKHFFALLNTHYAHLHSCHASSFSFQNFNRALQFLGQPPGVFIRLFVKNETRQQRCADLIHFSESVGSQNRLTVESQHRLTRSDRHYLQSDTAPDESFKLNYSIVSLRAIMRHYSGKETYNFEGNYCPQRNNRVIQFEIILVNDSCRIICETCLSSFISVTFLYMGWLRLVRLIK